MRVLGHTSLAVYLCLFLGLQGAAQTPRLFILPFDLFIISYLGIGRGKLHTKYFPPPGKQSTYKQIPSAPDCEDGLIAAIVMQAQL